MDVRAVRDEQRATLEGVSEAVQSALANGAAPAAKRKAGGSDAAAQPSNGTAKRPKVLDALLEDLTSESDDEDSEEGVAAEGVGAAR